MKNHFLLKKPHFLFCLHDKKMLFLANDYFLAHFWQYDPVTYFRLDRKRKSDFLQKKNHFLFYERAILAEIGSAVNTNPKLLWKISLFLQNVEDFKTWFFVPTRDLLSFYNTCLLST